MPIIAFARTLLSLVGVLLLGAVIYFAWTWWTGAIYVDDAGVAERLREDWRLWTALALIAFSALGRLPMLLFLARSDTDPTHARHGQGETVQSPTGALLYVESEGSDDGPVIIATHGWGLDSTIWRYLRRDLAEQRALSPNSVVVWDLAGIGRSRAPDGEVSLEAFAEDLETLVLRAAPRRVILVGHSIGGMTIQTLLRDRPEIVRDRVDGVVLINTTYTNPLKTMILSDLAQALRKPVLEPLFRLTILLKPLAWLSAWQSYLNGLSHVANRLQFAGSVTRSQLDHTALLGTRNSPAVLARGNLAMFDWSASGALSALPCPLLIIGGEQDIVTKLEASATLQAQAREAELEPVSNANHMGFLERSHHYNGLIAEFVATHGRASPIASSAAP